MLEGGARAGGEPDVGVAPADRAEHLAAGGAQLVQRPGVARGYQRRAVFLLFDGVDVEVVEGPADAGRAGRAVAVGERDVVEAVPLPAHEPGAQVEFLKDAVGHGAVARAADVGEIAPDRGEHRQHGGRAIGYVEVVQVGFVAVGRVHASQLAV